MTATNSTYSDETAYRIVEAATQARRRKTSNRGGFQSRMG